LPAGIAVGAPVDGAVAAGGVVGFCDMASVAPASKAAVAVEISNNFFIGKPRSLFPRTTRL
jgi:hypothetical protein